MNSMVWTLLITIVLCLIHLSGEKLGKIFDTTKHGAHSLGGGMAIAYVFLYLLPELELGDQVLGEPVHFIALAGFTGYYAAERWAALHKNSESTSFHLRLGMLAIYNWLIIYSLPEVVETGAGYALLFSVTLGLHLLSSDYNLRSLYRKRFQSYGRWVLFGALVLGFINDIFHEPVDPFVASIWTALLSGFVLSSVFRDEAPDFQTAKLSWFVLGVSSFASVSVFLN